MKDSKYGPYVYAKYLGTTEEGLEITRLFIVCDDDSAWDKPIIGDLDSMSLDQAAYQIYKFYKSPELLTEKNKIYIAKVFSNMVR